MTKRKSKIPRFKTYEEEAEFWDTHSIEEFEDELEEVELKVKGPLKHSFMVSFDAKSLDELVEIAASKGSDFITLAQTWITERLAQEREKSGQSPKHEKSTSPPSGHEPSTEKSKL